VLAALSAALTASLDGIDVLLATLLHDPVEPSLLRLELAEGTVLSYGAVVIRAIVLDPLCISQANTVAGWCCSFAVCPTPLSRYRVQRKASMLTSHETPNTVRSTGSSMLSCCLVQH
jgi:hypothetical protein